MQRFVSFGTSIVLVMSTACGAPEEAKKEIPMELVNSLGSKLVLIPRATFTMGAPVDEAGRYFDEAGWYDDEAGRYDDEIQHEVTISQNFYLSATQVTQAQYQRVMGVNPSGFQGEALAEFKEGRKVRDVDSSDFPVETVSWDDAVEFCERLSALPEEKAAGRVYRLPTEAEWEYACRAGSETAYSSGDDPELGHDYAWFGSESSVKTKRVGQKRPNAWGLYDMHGNVMEWCSDWYDAYPREAVTDPIGPNEGDSRIRRGGGSNSDVIDCRSAVRYAIDPWFADTLTGFRVAISQPRSHEPLDIRELGRR